MHRKVREKLALTKFSKKCTENAVKELALTKYEKIEKNEH